MSGGLTAAETAVFSVVVPALGFALLLFTMGASWAAAAVSVISAVTFWLCLARRVLIGNGWLADRRLWRSQLAIAADVRAVEVVENGHGGVFRLHPVQGRPHTCAVRSLSLRRRSGLDLDPADAVVLVDGVQDAVVGQVEDRARSVTVRARRLEHGSWTSRYGLSQQHHPSRGTGPQRLPATFTIVGGHHVLHQQPCCAVWT